MDDLTLVATFTLVILVFCVLLALFLLTVKTENRLGNRLLALYFAVFAIHISVFYYSHHIVLPSAVEMLRDQIIELASPLLFLYLLASIYSDFRLRWIHLLHLLPLIIGVLIYVPRFYGVSESDRLVFIENFDIQVEVIISYVVSTVISIVYLGIMFFELKKYKAILIDNYADTSLFNYRWLLQLTVVVSLIFVFSQFKQVYKMLGTDLNTLNVMRLVLILFLLGFLFWIVLKSMYQPELFKAIDTNDLLMAKEQERAAEGQKGDVDDLHVAAQLESLKTFMEDHEPYLDATLTLQKLAHQFGTHSRDLSILINHHLNQHFFDFIAEYRVKKAMNILADPSKKKLTILEVLYDVGFNSKSPFNKAFKKHTGLTPSAYRVKYCK